MKKLIYTLPLLLALGACSNEDVTTPAPDDYVGNGESYYLTMDIAVPHTDGTRSVDDPTTATLDGTDNEELIENVTLYILDGDDGTDYDKVLFVVPSASVKKETAVTGKDATWTAKFKVENTATTSALDIADLVGLAGKDINLVVACNTNTNFAYTLDAGSAPKFVERSLTSFAAPVGDFILGTANGTTSSIKGQVLPMTSVSRYALNAFKNISGETNDKFSQVRKLFDTLEENAWVYKVNENSGIDVERAVARLDIKDKTANWDYSITGDDATTFKLHMYSVQPVNVNKKSYLFRHRAAGSATEATGDIEIFSLSSTSSDVTTWIADPTWGIKQSASPYYLKTNSAANFINPLTTTTSTTPNLKAYTVNGTDGIMLTSGTTKPYIQDADRTQDGYYAWCYVTENTIPSTAMMQLSSTQTSDGPTYATDAVLAKYGTAVAFRFQMYDNTGTSVITSSTTADKLPPEMLATYDQGKITKLTITMPQSGKYMELEPENDAEGNIFLTYYGFINHNNSSAGTIDDNKYGVVRNNIYQLMVDEIKNLPFPEDPRDYFLKLNINVLKWEKRVNNFKF